MDEIGAPFANSTLVSPLLNAFNSVSFLRVERLIDVIPVNPCISIEVSFSAFNKPLMSDTDEFVIPGLPMISFSNLVPRVALFTCLRSM